MSSCGLQTGSRTGGTLVGKVVGAAWCEANQRALTHFEADEEGALEMHIDYVLSTGQCCFKYDIVLL